MFKPRPIQEPMVPNMAANGKSSVVLPAAVQALRNLMWAKQIEPQVKKLERPDKDNSHVKMVLPEGASLM